MVCGAEGVHCCAVGLVSPARKYCCIDPARLETSSPPGGPQVQEREGDGRWALVSLWHSL